MTTETEAAFAELLERGGRDARPHGRAAPADDPTPCSRRTSGSSPSSRWRPTCSSGRTRPGPRFVEIVGPYKKWGGDNADAFYCYAPIDPDRTYRVTLEPGDAVYISLTVYGGPDDGRYSERIVGTVNSRDARAPGRRLHPHRPLAPTEPDEPGVAWIRLEPDAVAAITRDYLEDPVRGRRAAWHIEADDPPDRIRQDDADLARRLRAMTHVGARAGEHRAASRLRHAQRHRPALPGADHDLRLGGRRRRLRHGRLRARRRRGPGHPWPLARVRLLEHVPVEPAAAHLQLRLRARHHQRGAGRPTSPTARGPSSWPHGGPAHPNWVSTAGHRKGRIWFRWFLPGETPEQPQVEVAARWHRCDRSPAPVRIDDLAEPRFSDEARAILDFMEEAGSQLTLDPAALMDAADDRDRAGRLRRSGLRAAARPPVPGHARRGRLQRAPASSSSTPSSLGLLKNRLLVEDLIAPPPRDPRRADHRPDRHLRPAPHRHHPPAQPHVGRPRPAFAPLLGEPRAGPGRTTSGPRPAHPTRGWSGRRWRCRSSTSPCPTSTGCTR